MEKVGGTVTVMSNIYSTAVPILFFANDMHML